MVGNVELSENEKKILNNNLQLAILDEFNEETLEREVENVGIKAKWDIWNNPEMYEDEVFEDAKKAEDDDDEIDKWRQVFDAENKVLSLAYLPTKGCSN